MQIGGKVSFRIDGRLYSIGDGEVTCNPGGFKREAILSSHGPVGFLSKPLTPSLEVELIHTKELEVSTIIGIEDATVMAELGNGQTFVLFNAWWASEGDIGSDGKIKGKFEGLKGEFVVH